MFYGTYALKNELFLLNKTYRHHLPSFTSNCTFLSLLFKRHKNKLISEICSEYLVSVEEYNLSSLHIQKKNEMKWKLWKKFKKKKTCFIHHCHVPLSSHTIISGLSLVCPSTICDTHKKKIKTYQQTVI